MKTLFLTALATGNRVSELAALSRTAVSIPDNAKKITLPVKPGFLYKNQTMSRTPPNIVIKALLNKDGSPHNLCPIDALRRWLRLSALWESDAIFINPKSKKRYQKRFSILLFSENNQCGKP